MRNKILGGFKHRSIMCIGNILLKSEFLYKLLFSNSKHIKKYKLNTLFDFAQTNKNIVKTISLSVEREYEKPLDNVLEYEKSFSEDSKKCIEKRKCTRQYVCLLNNATVRGDTDGVVCDNFYLTDKIEFDKEGFIEHPAQKTISNKENILIYDRNKTRKKISCAISLIKMWSYNYFHFVFEGMSKLGSVEEMEDYKDWPIIIDKCVKNDSRNIDLINLLNKNKREIIWIEQCEQIDVEKLIVPACMTWGVWNIELAVKNAWGYMIDKSAGEYLRNTILSQYVAKKKYNCVYIARGNNNRLSNESDIINIFKDAGFDIFCPDKVKTFEEELDCFSSAKCIVLCAGGASTNLVFCDKSADIFCILPFKYRCDNAQDVTSTVSINIKLRDAVVEEDGGFLMKSRFYFPIEKCQEIIEYCKKKEYL